MSVSSNSPVRFTGGPVPGPLAASFMRAGQPGQNPYVPGSCTTSPHVGWFSLPGDGFDAGDYYATGAINVELTADPNLPLLNSYAFNQTPPPKFIYGPSGVDGYMFPTMTFDIVFQNSNTGQLQLARLTALKAYYLMFLWQPPYDGSTVANLVVYPTGGLTFQALGSGVIANIGPIPGADIQARPWSNPSGAVARFAAGARVGTRGLRRGTTPARPGANPGAVALLHHYARTFTSAS